MKTIFKNGKLLALPLLLAACTVGDDYVFPGFDVPQSWLGAKPTEHAMVKTQWWKDFNDPLLNELVEKAHKQNLTLEEAKARLTEARALADGANANLLPLVNVGAGVGKTNGGKKSFEAGFDALWEIDIFGRNTRIAEAAGANAQSFEAELEDVELSLTAEVVRQYIEARLYQRQLEIARQSVETQTRTAGITEARYNEGVESQLELARARAQASTTKAQIPLYEALFGASIFNLEFLLAQKPGSLAMEFTENTPIPFTENVTAISTPLEVISRRPDVKAAERRLAEATALKGAAIAQLYPNLTLSGALGLQSSSAGDLFRSSSKVTSIGAQLLAPLFDFGRISADIDASDARKQQAFAQYKSAVLAALADVETALLAAAKENVRASELRIAHENSRKAVEVASLQYKEGIISQLDVLQAQSAEYNAARDLAESEANYGANLAALSKALALK